MTKFEELMNNTEFTEELDNLNSFEQISDAFAKNGVNLEDELDLNTSTELSENDLDDVSGGLSIKELNRIVKSSINVVKEGKWLGTLKYSMSAGVLLRAYYDVKRYGNATRTYSEKEIMRAARYMGLED